MDYDKHNDKYNILEEYFSGDKQLPTAPILYSKFNELIDGNLAEFNTMLSNAGFGIVALMPPWVT